MNISAKMELIYLGIISNSYSLNPKLFITDIPAGMPVIKPDTKVNIGYSKQFSKEFTIASWDISSGKIIAELKEINTPEQAAALKNSAVFIKEDNIIEVLADNNYHKVGELENCQVFDYETGDVIGKVVDVWLLPANDVWVVETTNGKLPVPAIEEVIKKVDINSKRIEILLIPGLLDLLTNEPEH
ncbi:MAG: rimM [Ignavibacteria bacterium]|nr:rimM [Ignavibacteria bacterium]